MRDATPEEALAELRKAVNDKDLDDVKEAVKMYVKAMPDTTYPELEKLLRDETIGLFLIGIEKEHLLSTLTNMDFQGNLDKKFTVTYRFSKLPPRPRERTLWPASDDENMTRLADGGEIVARGIPKCTNCDEMGHSARDCSQERQENLERPEVKCINCDELGHRMRDCAYLPAGHQFLARANPVNRQGEEEESVRVPQLQPGGSQFQRLYRASFS